MHDHPVGLGYDSLQSSQPFKLSRQSFPFRGFCQSRKLFSYVHDLGVRECDISANLPMSSGIVVERHNDQVRGLMTMAEEFLVRRILR